MGVCLLALLLAGCGGRQPLSEAMASINKEYGEVEDQATLLNVMRRSVGLPAYFTSLTTVRGRNRITGGGSFSVPFGPDAPSRFDFSPNFSIEQGPNFEVAIRTNKEFYRGYLAPLGAQTIHTYLDQDFARELVLSLIIKRIRIRGPEGRDERALNTPDQPHNHARFRALLERLVDQGLATETIELVRDGGPEIVVNGTMGLDAVLSARDKGLRVEEIAPDGSGSATKTRRYRLLQADPSVRFCFRAATGRPFTDARCASGAALTDRRYTYGDRRYFGTADGTLAVLDAGDQGTVEIHTRSLAEVLDYLGEAARVQLNGGQPPSIRTPAGAEPMFVVVDDGGTGGAFAVSVEFEGRRIGIPRGAGGGQSGAVLTIVSHLLAQAQSVRDLPLSNAVTIVGD